MAETNGAVGEHHHALDGVRFVAFLLVFFFHALQWSPVGNWPIIRFGYLGVPIFFVLSGFLIGRILLDLREKTSLPLSSKLKRFYLRRSLRIFPVYYLFIGILIFFHVMSGNQDPRAEASFPWHMLYLTNLRSFLVGMDQVYEGHFWSLAVEEHFYLIAPLVVLVLHPTRLARLLGTTILAVAMARGVVYWSGSSRDFWVLSPMQFDLLGLGIATALIERKGSFLGVTPFKLRCLGLLGAVVFVLYITQFYYPIRHTGVLFAMVGSLSLGLAVAAGVLTLWQRPASMISRLLGWAPLAYLGQISYGLYLFHPNCLGWMAHYYGNQTLTNALVGLAVTILVAMLSWHTFEKPINNLKNRFAYASSKRLPEGSHLVKDDSVLQNFPMRPLGERSQPRP
jgi:peptidoglycan/LPS O-acetylase OafA/YrhL